MGKFTTFAIGLLVPILLLGCLIAGASYFNLFTVPDTVKKNSAAQEADKIWAPTNRFAVVGQAHVSKLLQATLAGNRKIGVKVRVEPFQHGYGGAVGSSFFEGVKFPFDFDLKLSPQTLPASIKSNPSGLYDVSVNVCIGVAGQDCRPPNAPRISGTARIKLFSSDSPPPSGPGEIKVKVPPIVLNQYVEPTDLVACLKSSRRIQGKILPTAAFDAGKGSDNRFALVAIPVDGEPVFLTEASAKSLTGSAMEALRKDGIIYTGVTMGKGTGGTFTLEIQPGFESQQYDFYAQQCGRDERFADCAGKVFPFPAVLAMEVPERGWYRPVPENLKSPSCGATQAVLYLNEWKAGALDLDDGSAFH